MMGYVALHYRVGVAHKTELIHKTSDPYTIQPLLHYFYMLRLLCLVRAKYQFTDAWILCAAIAVAKE